MQVVPELEEALLPRITAEKERIAMELNVARDIQAGGLPHDFEFPRQEFELYATMDTAKEVGGDFYDFYMLDENHLAVTMADVSGKGVRCPAGCGGTCRGCRAI